jgi:hypothetical protein
VLLPRGRRRGGGAKPRRGGRGHPPAPSSGGRASCGPLCRGCWLPAMTVAARGACQSGGKIPRRLPRSVYLCAPSQGPGVVGDSSGGGACVSV